MKAELITITVQPSENALAVRIRRILALLFLFIGTASAAAYEEGVNSVWLNAPPTDNWASGANWSTNPYYPADLGDTAAFNTSIRTSPMLTGTFNIDSITFNPGASSFSLKINGTASVLTLGVDGVVNNSGKVQKIIVGGLNSGLYFYNTASGGNVALINATPTAYIDISHLTDAGMKAGSIAGVGRVYLGAKDLAVGGDNTSTVFSGIISDGEYFTRRSQGLYIGGSLTKVGAGTLTLTGANTYTGSTTVDDGSLIVNGSIASPMTIVNAPGFLGGTGVLGHSLVNGGVVSPGDAPGTLTVRGNYSQNPGGTLSIQVAGLAPGQFDLLAVGGHASLAGALQIVSAGGFQFHLGDQITFLTAKDGITGAFETIQNGPGAGVLLMGKVVYLSNSVVYQETQGSFGDFAKDVCKTPNHIAVAEALDSAVGNPSAAKLIDFLDDQSADNLCKDLGLLEPEELASIFNLGVSLADVQSANLERRMEDIQAGSSGFSSSGLTLNSTASGFGLAGATGPEGKSGKSVVEPAATPGPDNKWGAFVTGLGEFADIGSTNNAAGYNLTTGGLTLGVDYRVCSHFAIGLTAGYAHTDASLADGGALHVDGGKFGAYATAFGSGFYLDAAATGGYSSYDTHRTALLGAATGSTDGGDFTGLVATGYDWKKGGFSIGPTASFQYTYVGIDGFTEHGSLAPLNFNSKGANSLQTALGMKTSYDWKVGHVHVIPEVSAGWQHEYGDRDYALAARFASGAGNGFTVHGPDIGRDSLLIGAGVSVQWNDRVSTYGYYDGEVATTNYQSQNVSAGIRVDF